MYYFSSETDEERVTIRPSKSDTSLTDGFVMIESHKGEQCLKKGKFRKRLENLNTCFICNYNISFTSLGFKWQRQLMFRSKLTMHTAYDRRDNAEPASITALTVSKDHKILYVGE